MRRVPLVVLLLGLLAAPARPGPEDLGSVAGRDALRMSNDEPVRCVFAAPDARVVDVESLPEPARPLVRTLLDDPCVIEVSAFRRTGSGAAEEFLSSAVAVADAAALEALRDEIRAGVLTLLGRTRLVAEPGEVVGGEDTDATSADTSTYIEPAIGVSVAFPVLSAVRTGLRARVRPVLHADGAWHVDYRALVAADARIEPVETIAGRRSSVRIASFEARGVAELREGEVAVARASGPAGNGFVVLVRAVHAPGVPLPAAVGAGWLVLPGTLRPAQGARGLERVGLRDDLTSSLDCLDVELADELGGWDEQIEPRPHAPAWADAAVDVEWTEAGVILARADYDQDEHLRGLAHEALAERSSRTVTVVHPGTGRIVVPAAGGASVGGFVGEHRTAFAAELEFESGCDTCVQVAEWVERDGFGLGFEAVLDGTGGLEIDACARVEEGHEQRTFRARRSLPGHSEITWDEISLPFVTDRLIRVRSHVPPGGARVAGEIDVAVTGDVRHASGLRGLDVSTSDTARRRVWTAPRSTARLLVRRRTPHVVDWQWETSCGMTYRSPFVSAIPKGMHVALTRERDGELHVAGTVRGGLRIDDPAFDMKDGVVEILRQPVLTLAATYPDADLGEIAAGDGLALRIDVPEAGRRARLRSIRTFSDGAPRRVRYVDGAPLFFVCGTETWLPEWVADYTSNHASGEAAVAPRARSAGVQIVLEEERSGVARGFASIRARAEARRFDLTKFQAPERPDRALSLLLPEQPVRRVPLVVPLDAALIRETPAGMPDPVRLEFREPSEEDER